MNYNEQKSTELIFWSWGHNLSRDAAKIMRYVELIKHDLSNQPLDLDSINRDLESIKRISSEIATTPLPFIVERISVNLLLQELIERFQKHNHDKNIMVKIDLAGEPHVVANSVWLANAFDELLNNAAEALCEIEDKGIEITSQIDEDTLTIFVKDKGKGIERKQLSEILMDPPILRADGKGRGLYIVRLTIELYGGHLTMDNSSKGTTISASLPISNRLE